MKRTYTAVLEVDDALDDETVPTNDLDHLNGVATWIEGVLMEPRIKVDVTVYAGDLADTIERAKNILLERE